MQTENFDPGPNSQLDHATGLAYYYFRGLPMPGDFFSRLYADPRQLIRLGASDY